MKTQLFLLLLALSVLSTQAQSLSIKGRVTDASQEAVTTVLTLIVSEVKVACAILLRCMCRKV